MYAKFFDLAEMPFELTPNPKFLYVSRQHAEALGNLAYGLLSAKGITALIGEAGTGKTTLLHAVLASSRLRHVTCMFISNPTLTRAEFVEMLSQRFELGSHARESKTGMLTELETLLRERRANGLVNALVIDEAQSLSRELLEEVRLLANIETSTEKLLPLVLVGQPELRDRLSEPGLRQLKQRITLRCEITPFNPGETVEYIVSRIRTAGGDAAHLFTREAVMLIHERSGGIPRTISVLCDNALLIAYALETRPVTRAIVLEVTRDFDLGANPAVADRPADTARSYRLSESTPIPRAAGDRAVTTIGLPGVRAEPEPLLADKVVAGTSDFFSWCVDKFQRRPSPNALPSSGVVDSRYATVGFRDRSDESR